MYLSPRGLDQIAEICEQVALAAGIRVELLFGHRRPHRIARARQLAMTIIRERFHLSLMDVGEIFHRDHGTVIHAVKVIAQARETEPLTNFLYLSLVNPQSVIP